MDIKESIPFIHPSFIYSTSRYETFLSSQHQRNINFLSLWILYSKGGSDKISNKLNKKQSVQERFIAPEEMNDLNTHKPIKVGNHDWMN